MTLETFRDELMDQARNHGIFAFLFIIALAALGYVGHSHQQALNEMHEYFRSTHVENQIRLENVIDRNTNVMERMMPVLRRLEYSPTFLGEGRS